MRPNVQHSLVPACAAFVCVLVASTVPSQGDARVDARFFNRMPPAPPLFTRPLARTQHPNPNYPITPTVFGTGPATYGWVYAFKQSNGALLATITDAPVNSCGFPPMSGGTHKMFVDRYRNLWTIDGDSVDGSGLIREFPKGSSTSTLTLNGTQQAPGHYEDPWSVSVDAWSTGYVYVGNSGQGGEPPAWISVWTPADQTCGHFPSYALRDPLFAVVTDVANDHDGNLYVSFLSFPNPYQASLCFITKANATAGPSNHICDATASPGDFVSTVAFTNSGYLGNMQVFKKAKKTLGIVNGSGIDLYHPLPLSPQPGPPALACTTINAGFASPSSFAITDAKGLGMWVADYSAPFTGGALYEVANSNGPCPDAMGPGSIVHMITGYYLWNVAVSPAFTQ